MAEPRACGVGPVQDSVRRADVNASALGKLETQLIHPPLPLKDSFVKLSSVNLPNKPATSPRAPTKKLRRTAHPLCLCCLQTQHQCCLHLDPGSLTAPVTEVRSPWNPFQICGPVYASFLRVTPALNPSGEAGRLVHRYVWQSRREGFSPAPGTRGTRWVSLSTGTAGSATLPLPCWNSMVGSGAGQVLSCCLQLES